jgi:hypothetical protein
MSNGLLYNAEYDINRCRLRLTDKAGNIIVSFVVPTAVPKDDETLPLMFLSKQDNSYVTLKEVGGSIGTYKTSTDGTTWSSYSMGTSIKLNNDESIFFKRQSGGITPTPDTHYVKFSMVGKVEAYNNLYSMTPYWDSGSGTNLRAYAFVNLFEGCSALYRAPMLPTIPLSTSGDSGMQYYKTFKGCTNLTEAPYIPYTTINANACMYQMFQGCSRLAKVRCAATTLDTSSSNACLHQWLDGVAATGDFYTPTNTSWPSGVDGIPTGWTRHGLT